MKLGFIGVGTMGQAIIRGVAATGKVNAADIIGYSPETEVLTTFAAGAGITAADSNIDVVTQADVVILAVKPGVLPAVLGEDVVSVLQTRRPLVISIAAGTPIAKLAEWLGSDAPIVRVMSNVNATIGQAMSAVCANDIAGEQGLNIARDLFSSVGQVIAVDEAHFQEFTAISGSSPAWTYMYIDALAKGALKAGMPKAQAVKIAAQAVFGSAAMVLSDDRSPADLADAVCSPGGTTIAGVAALEAAGFTAAVMDAVDMTILRDEEIAQNK